MGEKGLTASLSKLQDELPKGYHLKIVPDAKGTPRVVGVPDEQHYDVDAEGKPDFAKPVDPHLIWNEKLGMWIPV